MVSEGKKEKSNLGMESNASLIVSTTESKLHLSNVTAKCVRTRKQGREGKKLRHSTSSNAAFFDKEKGI